MNLQAGESENLPLRVAGPVDRISSVPYGLYRGEERWGYCW